MIMRHLSPKSLASGAAPGGSPSGTGSRTVGPAAPTDVHRAGQAEDTGRDRSRTRRRHGRHPAPRRPVFLDPERLARIARRGRARWTDVDQARAEARTTQSIDGRTGAGQTGECAAGAPAGACRGHHLDPKKVAALLGLPLATSDSDDAS